MWWFVIAVNRKLVKNTDTKIKENILIPLMNWVFWYLNLTKTPKKVEKKIADHQASIKNMATKGLKKKSSNAIQTTLRK